MEFLKETVRPGVLHDIRKRYSAIRKRTEDLCSRLKPEDYIVQPITWVSPPKWHLAHTTWFFETFVLKEALPNYRVFHPDFNFLFNSYYETVGERLQRNHRGILFRPPVEEIYAYRHYVDEQMHLLFAHPLTDGLLQTIELGLQHEQQHQELLVTDTKYIFFQHPLFPVWDERQSLDGLESIHSASWLSVPEGLYTIGFQGSGFCFDNELQPHSQFLHAFEISNDVIPNEEFLEFLQDGGYANPRLWLSEGWEWVKEQDIQHPLYWVSRKDEWLFYHLDGLRPLNPRLPLMHISYYEADAFARWKGRRLPTEAEWEVAASKFPSSFRNKVWEWTKTAYHAYPGFREAPGAVGEYNGKFMVNQMVLRGGSVATPPGHTRLSYRNFFHPHMQWQFSGLRLVKQSF